MDDKSKQTNESNKRNSVYRELIKWIVPIAINVILALFTFNLSKTTAEQSGKNFETQNRPYVLESKIHWDSIKIGQTAKATVSFINYGKTPALIEYRVGKIEFSDSSILNQFNYSNYDTVKFQFQIAPNDTINFQIENLTVVTSDLINAISERKKFVFMHGSLVYSDFISQKKSVSNFCFQVVGTYMLVNPVHNDLHFLE
jgi:hypothetical protein